ncbi:MAG: hypothetical protein QM765_34485 [Myxococcales bacterium]
MTLRFSSRSEVPAECEAAARKLGARPLGQVGKTCLVGEDHGEFGAAVHVIEGGASRKLSDVTPVALVFRGEEVLLLEGLEHLRSAGSLARLSADAGKTWEYVHLAELPAYPIAWAVDGRNLLVAVRESDDSTPCDSPRAGDKERPVFVVTGGGEVLRVPDVEGDRCPPPSPDH